MHPLSQVHGLMARFRVANAGNIAMIFALCLGVLCGAIGVAVDYGRGSSTRSELQLALDAAVLAAARRHSVDDPEAQGLVAQYARANFSSKYPNLRIVLESSIGVDGKVRAKATVTVPTLFMQILGTDAILVSAKSEARFGAGLADIALVLDNTYSMNGASIDGLKTAAKGLVDILYAAPDAERTVRVGLVPFAQYVNVGLGYRGESWLSAAPDSSATSNQCWNTYPNAVASNCRDVTSTYTTYNDGVPTTTTSTSQQCDWDYRDPVEVCGDVTTTQVWNGCVGSRAHPLDTGIGQDFATPVPGIMNVTCTQPLARLDNDKDAIKAQIDGMVAIGETYLQSGLIWGWRVVSPQAPFADGHDRAAHPEVKRFIVLMTDGANTKSPNYPDHAGGDVVMANSLTAETCTSIRAENTYIYTVAFNVTDATIRNLLRDCASAPPYYFEADDTDELRTAFAKIANNVVAIRLTQ